MTVIGYQVSGLKEYLTTPKGVLSTFAGLKKIGYQAIQIQWIHPLVPMETTQKALLETGLACVAVQDKFEVIRVRLHDFIAMSRLWNSKILSVSTIPRHLMNKEGILAFCEDMKTMANECKTFGITLSYHPVSFDYELIQDKCAVETVMETLPEIGLTLCIYHAVKAGMDPVALIEKYEGRIDLCHFKDFVIDSNGSEYLVPTGQGQINWRPIFKACQETNVPWGLAEQESFQKNAFVCARDSYAYMTKEGLSTSP